MAAIPFQVEQAIHDYAKKVGSRIPLKKVYLFGSYAKGTFTEDSDIDVAFFSDYFSNMERTEAITMLLLEAMDYELDIEPVPFTERDFNEPIGIAEEILKTGIEIAVF